MKAPDVLVVKDPSEYAARAVTLIAAAAHEAIAARGRFRIALAGGATPRPIYAALAVAPGIDWPHWEIFWGDERTAPPDSPESNYAMAAAALLKPLAERTVAPGLVERLHGEDDPIEAARHYDRVLRTLADGETPRFDLILLGMGPDGHTASLFPHTPALEERSRLVVANDVPQLNTVRLTFTYPLLNAARQILFLVRGADKAAALHAVIAGPVEMAQWPSQGIQPTSGHVTWLVDDAAAQLLDR